MRNCYNGEGSSSYHRARRTISHEEESVARKEEGEQAHVEGSKVSGNRVSTWQQLTKKNEREPGRYTTTCQRCLVSR
jgi:hypothetical protein